MAVRQIQSTFSFGELDPKLYAKVDFAGYFKGARKLRNVMVIPQGGVKRRFGTDFTDTVKDRAVNVPISDASKINGTVFDFSRTKTFLIILRPEDEAMSDDMGIDIYLDEAIVATVNTAEYTADEIENIYLLRAQDRVILLHKEHQPQELVRGANDATWTLTPITFANFPVFDFSLIDGTSYRGAADTFTPSATSGVGITLTGSGAFFTAGHVGGLFIGGGGIMRITAVNAGGTVATGDTEADFDSTAAIKGANALLQEVAWGDYTGGTPAGSNRGWPSLGTFFQFRMMLANSLSLNNLIWSSAQGDFYNFDDSAATDLDGFAIGLGSNGNEEIQSLVGTKALVGIGFTGIYSTSLFIDQPITPGNAFMNEQARDGGSNIDAQVVDNQIFYVDENQQQIRSAQYDINTSSYNVVDASILSPQLVNDPQSTASFSPKNNDGNFYMITNVDGSLGVYQSLIAQSVQAWSLSTTRGSFKKIFSSRSECYALVRRSFNTGEIATVDGFADNIYTANQEFEAYVDVTVAAQSNAVDLGIFTRDKDYLVIGHEAPFNRVAFALDTVCNTSILPTFEYLDNTGNWTSFAPTDGTSGFTANGTINWNLDNDTPNWFPQNLEEITGINLPGEASVPDTQFWMRIRRNVLGPIDVAFIVDPAFNIFTNVTPQLSDPATDATLFSQDNEYLLIGQDEQFEILNIALNTVSSADIAPTFEFLDSTNTWVTFVPTDNTTGFTVAGSITWSAAALTNWALAAVNGNPDKYWIRIRRTENTVGTPPIEDTIFLDVVTTPVEETVFINSEDRVLIEKVDFNEYTDSTKTTTSDANGLVTGLDHLCGQMIYATVDSTPEGPYFVDATGSVTISTASADVKVGINYIPEIEPMPLVAQQQFTETVYQPKHLKTIYIDYFESLGVLVNGQEVPTLSLNNFVLDQTPIPASSFHEITPMRGWNPRGRNIISQDLPLPMTIIGVGYRMEIS